MITLEVRYPIGVRSFVSLEAPESLTSCWNYALLSIARCIYMELSEAVLELPFQIIPEEDPEERTADCDLIYLTKVSQETENDLLGNDLLGNDLLGLYQKAQAPHIDCLGYRKTKEQLRRGICKSCVV